MICLVRNAVIITVVMRSAQSEEGGERPELNNTPLRRANHRTRRSTPEQRLLADLPFESLPCLRRSPILSRGIISTVRRHVSAELVVC